MYNKRYHEENKERIKLYQKEYRLKHDDKQRCKEYYHKNKNGKIKEYREKNKEKRRQQSKEYRIKNIERLKAYRKWYEGTSERKAYHRRWNREHPKSRCSSYPLELELAMNAVRVRDNNTCQWQGCGLNHRQAPIHVHHIFPRSEYPELELVEQYMICYCANHHGYWHRMRGDPCHTILNNSKFEVLEI